MEKVNLYTHGGHFVATVDVPKWLVPYEVIAWDDRLFYARATNRQYREVSYYIATKVQLVEEQPIPTRPE